LRLTLLWWVVGPLVAVLVAGVTVAAVRPVAYYTLSPGSARSVEPLVTITSGAGGPELHEEPVRDDIYFLTVTVRQPFGAEVLWALTDDRIEVVQRELVDGTQSREENRQFNRSLMTSAKDKAASVALERAGFEVTVRTTGAVVIDIGPEYPVAAVLAPGDTVVAAAGEPVESAEDLVAVVGARAPGDTLELTVEPLGSTTRRRVEAELVARPGEPARAMLGITLESRPAYDFPVDVAIDSGRVGGPSAGLAFALAILDRITPGLLTGGERIAVTGTIELDGSVGRVGGVRQKTEAAIEADARVFVVPADEEAEALEAAQGRIEVRAVATFEDALDVLVDLGGDPVPAPASAPAAGEG
jgi:PDZ domain-containing protein